MANENGDIVDGDQILAICADHMMVRGQLNNSTVVATVMSNLGLEIALRERGIRLLRTKVGDRFVVEAMREGGYNLGGEQSGHTVFLDHNTTGDGLLSALQVLAVMVRTGRPLSELAAIMPRIPQVLINLKVLEKKPLSQTPELGRVISIQEDKLGGRGRVLVRYSGTEPKLRIMVEAENEQLMHQAAEQIRLAAVDCLGAAE
jgi:phosphoglucosamine mutase